MSAALIEPDRQSVAAAPGRAASLIGLSRVELAAALAEAGVPEKQIRMRASQIWHWLYVRGATDFDSMTSMSKPLRAELAARFKLARPEIVEEQIPPTARANGFCAFPRAAPAGLSRSRPSTSRRKAAARSASPPRSGCTLTCSFCHTGTQKLVRNLTAEEIVGQVLLARERWAIFPPPRRPVRRKRAGSSPTSS
jgi:23S rRNA (adenine2503-C2)-methyltransferase